MTCVDVKKISAGLFAVFWVFFCHNLPNLYPGGRVKSTDADVNCNVLLSPRRESGTVRLNWSNFSYARHPSSVVPIVPPPQPLPRPVGDESPMPRQALLS